MPTRYLYLGLCLLGIALPYAQFVPWLADHGLNVSLLVSELFSTRIGAFFGMDVLASALTLLVLIGLEGRRLRVRHLWLPVVGTLLVGVSLGLPLFLYLRQMELEEA